LDVYPRRIFLSDKHFYNIHFATTTLPSTSITLTPLTTTSTRGNTFSYPSNFAVINLTLLTTETKIITLTSTTTAIDIRYDIIHTSTPPAINNRGDTIHSSTQLAFTTNSISYSTITSTNTLSLTATIWNTLLNNTTEITQFFNNINTNPTDNNWHTHSDNYYLNDHSRITTNIGIATYQISSCHAAYLLSPTITYLPPQFRSPNFSNFPTILTFRNAFSPQNFDTVPSRQTFLYQTFHTNIPQNFLVSSLLLSPPNFSSFQPSDDNNTLKQHHNSPITSFLYSELL
jgi:hypothetical protein